MWTKTLGWQGEDCRVGMEASNATVPLFQFSSHTIVLCYDFVLGVLVIVFILSFVLFVSSH